MELLSSTNVELMERGTVRCCLFVQTHISSLMSSIDHELPWRWPLVRRSGGEYARPNRMYRRW